MLHGTPTLLTRAATPRIRSLHNSTEGSTCENCCVGKNKNKHQHPRRFSVKRLKVFKQTRNKDTNFGASDVPWNMGGPTIKVSNAHRWRNKYLRACSVTILFPAAPEYLAAEALPSQRWLPIFQPHPKTCTTDINAGRMGISCTFYVL